MSFVTLVFTFATGSLLRLPCSKISWLTVFLCLLDLPTPSCGRPLFRPASKTQALQTFVKKKNKKKSKIRRKKNLTYLLTGDVATLSAGLLGRQPRLGLVPHHELLPRVDDVDDGARPDLLEVLDVCSEETMSII